MLEIPCEPQVRLGIKIVELNRHQLLQMGIDLKLVIENSLNSLNSSRAQRLALRSCISKNSGFSTLIDWLVSNRTGVILAEPELVVLSRHNASVKMGGVNLTVTPVVLENDLIRLQINHEHNETVEGNIVSRGDSEIPSGLTTTAQLRSGQTLVIWRLKRDKSHREKDVLILVTPGLIEVISEEELPPMPGGYVTPPSDDRFYR